MSIASDGRRNQDGSGSGTVQLNLGAIPAELKERPKGWQSAVHSHMLEELRVLVEPGAVVELRALNVQDKPGSDWRATVAGYFDSEHWPQLADAALKMLDLAEGQYITLNPVRADLLARAANRTQRKLKHTTADADILRRRWLPVDLDPGRPAGVSSTEAEHSAALSRQQTIRDALSLDGWPAPVLADSGNGAHLLYRVNLSAEDGGLIERCLKALAACFDDDLVKVDTAVHNPARIWKLYGSLARKGDSTPERPHRFAHLLSVPDGGPQVVPRELLEALVSKWTPQERKPRQPHNGSGAASSTTGTGASPYAQAALEGELAAVRSASVGTRNNTLNRAAFALGQLVAGGELDRAAVEAALLEAALAAGLSEHEARKTIASGLAAGEKEPRQTPHNGRAGGRTRAAEEPPPPTDADAPPEAQSGSKPRKKGGPKAQAAAKDEPTPAEVGQLLSTSDRWMYVHELLWVYRGGVYRPDGEKVARKKVQDLRGEKASQKFGNEVVYWLGVEHDAEPERVDTGEVVNVRNGLLNPLTGSLCPHTPDVLTTAQLPVAWRADAYHERGDQFLNEVLPDPETRAILEEALGYCLTADCRYEKAVMLTGEGANGKSVMLGWLAAMLGKNNVSNVKLQELGDRFKTAKLLGKMANIFADLPKEALKETGDFKMLVSGDPLTGEWKYKLPFEFLNRAKLFFSANEMPKTRDRTQAFWRRWLVVPFPHTFREGDPRRDPTLKAKLATPEARSYLLRLAAEGLQRLDARGYFGQSDATRGALADYQRESDNVLVFLEECTVEQTGALVGKDELFGAYKKWCEAAGMTATNKLSFGKQLRTLRPKVEESRRNLGGKGFRATCWVNLGLLSDRDDNPPASGLGEKANPDTMPEAGGYGAEASKNGPKMAEARQGSNADGKGVRHSVRVDPPQTIAGAREQENDGRRQEGEARGQVQESVESSLGGGTLTLCPRPVDTGSEPGRQPGRNPDATQLQPCPRPVDTGSAVQSGIFEDLADREPGDESEQQEYVL